LYRFKCVLLFRPDKPFTFAKEFFNYYDLELPAKDLTFIRHNLPKGNVMTIEKGRDPETIRIILQHLDVKAENEHWVYHKSILFY
jgi:hypothetical protein